VALQRFVRDNATLNINVYNNNNTISQISQKQPTSLLLFFYRQTWVNGNRCQPVTDVIKNHSNYALNDDDYYY